MVVVCRWRGWGIAWERGTVAAWHAARLGAPLDALCSARRELPLVCRPCVSAFANVTVLEAVRRCEKRSGFRCPQLGILPLRHAVNSQTQGRNLLSVLVRSGCRRGSQGPVCPRRARRVPPFLPSQQHTSHFLGQTAGGGRPPPLAAQRPPVRVQVL